MEENEKNDKIKKTLDLLNSYKMGQTSKQEDELLDDADFLKNEQNNIEMKKDLNEDKEKVEMAEEDDFSFLKQPEKEKEDFGYPEQLADTTLEKCYLGLLLNQIKSIAVYYFTFDDCFFVNEDYLNIYKKILFTDGERYAPQKAKDNFNFSKENQELYEMKNDLQQEFENSKYKLEDVFRELKKVFILRKNFLGVPVKEIQEKIADIMNYELYSKMSPEDVESAVNQVTTTQKFKRSVLNNDLTDFLVEGDNTLTNGLSLPFPILSASYKGIRQGETAAYAMPSNYGKSRLTINLAAYIALVHQKKVLVISNEMSEEKMKLCLITTIINNPEIQKIHGKKLHVSENQLLDFKYRPDDPKAVKVDEDGFVLKLENESHVDFINRLRKCSTEFNDVLKVTNWFAGNLYNSIHFIDITDHTNEELKKVIMNYYYKEKVQYVFYDTLKTDIDNIGNGEELKKTATILSNLAQNFNMHIGASLQLSETVTDPINVSVNDMAVSRTVKEVLDTLCLFKQIHNEDLDKYEFALDETFSKTYDLKKYLDPNVRYYACVIDKNRAGSKPKLVFILNLAYNDWHELGYIRLKSKK